MADNWYYAQHGTRQGPVSKEELQVLLSRGELLATDLVWTDGMADWVPADTVAELLPRSADADAITADPPRFAPMAVDDVEPLPEPPPIELEEPSPALLDRKLPLPYLIAGFGVIILIGVGIAAFVMSRGGSQSPPLEGSFNWSLTTNRHQVWDIHFFEGHRVNLQVNSDGVSDIDLYCYLGQNLIAQDEGLSPHCRLSFVAQKSGKYRVKVWNRNLIPDPERRNGPNNGVLTFTQFDPRANPDKAGAVNPGAAAGFEGAANPAPLKEAAPQKNKAPAIAAVPAEGLLLDIRDRLVKKKGLAKNVHTVMLEANVTYVFDLESTAFDPVLEINNSRGQRLASNDDIAPDNRNARIVFQPPQAGNYQLVVRAFGLGTGAYRLSATHIPKQ